MHKKKNKKVLTPGGFPILHIMGKNNAICFPNTPRGNYLKNAFLRRCGIEMNSI